MTRLSSRRSLAEERFDDQIDDIADWHVSHEAAEQSESLDRVMQQLVNE